MGHQTLSRRKFLVTTAAVGGSMVLTVSRGRDARADGVQPGDNHPGSVEFSAWISIAPDDTVTVQVPTPEIGNGAFTQGAMTIAEELESDWTKMHAEFASPGRNLREHAVYNPTNNYEAFFSGRSTHDVHTKLYLQAGASARERLKAAAAARWHVPVSEIEAKNSVLTHKASGRTLRYGQVAADAAKIKLAVEPALKPQSEWTLLGKAAPGKINLAEIVNGTTVYGIDVHSPGMVYAALRQSPVQGGKLKSYDANSVMHMPGVLAVVTVDPDEPRSGKVGAPFGLEFAKPQSAVAVIAEHYWQAHTALEALKVEWDDGPGVQWKNTAQVNAAAIAALDHDSEKPLKVKGDVSGLKNPPAGTKIVEATYLTPYCEQACMEPLNGTALVTADSVELWHPSQHPDQAFHIAADETGLPLEKVTYHQPFVGGGFGRRVYGNDVRMVVAVAKKFPGRPVQVIWSREEMTRQGRYRPLSAARLKARLNSDGVPDILTVHTAGGPGMFTVSMDDNPYILTVPNARVDVQTVPLNILVGPYRGPGYNSFNFMMETFIDECAVAAGVDPLEYRLKLFAKWPDKGWEKCLKEVAEKSGWGKKLPRGMGQGIAAGNWGNEGGKPETGTTVAVVATVEVTQKGNIKVHTLDMAFDTGRIMNSNAMDGAIQGGALFGYNMAMNEGLTIKNGAIVEGNFDAYPIARIGDVPKVNVHFGGLTGNDRFSEIGEPTVGPVGPAIGNAIFQATGKRLRSTPFRLTDASWV